MHGLFGSLPVPRFYCLYDCAVLVSRLSSAKTSAASCRYILQAVVMMEPAQDRSRQDPSMGWKPVATDRTRAAVTTGWGPPLGRGMSGCRRPEIRSTSGWSPSDQSREGQPPSAPPGTPQAASAQDPSLSAWKTSQAISDERSAVNEEAPPQYPRLQSTRFSSGWPER
jgi:hypothetical protein